MKLYRYMSIEEFVKMSMGKNMQANYNQQFAHNNTDSKGFCFLGSKIVGKSTNDNDKFYEFSPEEAIQFLKGIVCDEILVEFEADNSSELHLGYGRYNSFYDSNDMTINEYSVMEYNKDIFKPLRFVISPNDVNIQDNTWEEFLEGKNYTIKDMIHLFTKMRSSPNTDGNLSVVNNLKLLPIMPNCGNDNIWRILKDDEKGFDRLVYGSPITDEIIYELKFDPENDIIDFGENIPEFWQPLKTLYDNNPNLSRNHVQLFEIAALIAEYPQILEIFDFMIEDNERFGPSFYLKKDDIVLSTNELSFYLKENNELDITYIDEDDDYREKSFLDIIQKEVLNQNEHTATEIGEYVSDIKSCEFIQGLKNITSEEKRLKEHDNPSIE